MAGPAKRPELRGVPTEKASARRAIRPGVDALDVILEPWTLEAEGFRYGVIGDSRQGKTTNLLEVLAAALGCGAGELAMVLDDKKREAQYRGQERVNLDDPTPIDPGEQVLVFRGDRISGVRQHPEALAAKCLEMARSADPTRTILVLDELKRCTSEDGKHWLCLDGADGDDDAGSRVKEVFTEGGALQISVAWSTQTPQEIPRAAVNNSTAVAIHRLGPNAANYVAATWLLDSEMVKCVRTLERGEFVLHRPGISEWDGQVYRFDV